MPCNLAVSIAKAGVSKPQLLALLVPDIVQQVTLAYLQQQYASLNPRLLVRFDSRIYFQVGTCRILIEDGTVRVTGTDDDTNLAETLANEIEQLLLQLADSLFQQQIQQLLGPSVTQVQTVQVDNEGVAQQAVVFSLDL